MKPEGRSTSRVRESSFLPPGEDALTRRIKDDGEPGTLTGTFSRLRAHLGRLSAMYGASDLQELMDRACDAVGELLDVSLFRLCRYNPAEQRYDVLAERGTGPVETGEEGGPRYLAGEMAELLNWAARSRQVVFFDLHDSASAEAPPRPAGDRDATRIVTSQRDKPQVSLDAATVRIGERTRASALCVIPVTGARGPLGAILVWVRDAQLASCVLEFELLGNLSAELGSRAEALAAAQRLRSLSSLFDNILESVPQGILVIGRDRRVMAINSNAEFLFDLKRVFVMDEDFEKALPPRLVTELNILMERLLLSPAVESALELELARGTTVSMGISASYLLDRGGQYQGWLFLCRDLSLSLEVQKLRDLDRLKTDFVNTVSHELKTPLTAILGGLDIVRSDMSAIPEEYRELVDVVYESAQNLRDMIFDLLNLSKLESGRATLKEAPVEVREMLEGRIRSLPPHPNHEISLHVGADVPPVMLDREKVVTAFSNFLTNAIKYSPQGGPVTVRAEVEDGRLVIAVKDSGLGIAPEHHDKIWEKFYRVDASYTSEIEGTGLGLVIVKRIVELHGGEVFVQSEVGKGSTFGLRIPLRPVPAQEPDAT
ncbi:MAG: PAS domain-containing protein [Planctomycetes bacterium]|nr:PAS domain-containing protein [Planctomycetota bacterium]